MSASTSTAASSRSCLSMISEIEAVDALMANLPTYSQSVPAPSYSFQPGCDEQVLQHTPSRVSIQAPPTGTFIKRSGRTTVILTEQEDDASTPIYGRHGVINGALLLEESQLVTEVTIEIEGSIETTISDGGGKSTKLIQEKHTLWSTPKASTSTSTNICPTELPLNLPLPATFRDGDADAALPPSFTGFFQGVPTVFAKVTYTLRIRVTRQVSSKIGFWTKTKQTLIPFKYMPRTRPNRPILPSPGFFSSIKTSPEEWFQASGSIKTRSTSSLQPLPVHLFIPAGRVYGIKDTIPFHLQLSGPAASLRELFTASTSALDRILSSDSQNTLATTSASSNAPPQTKPVVRVYIMRQVTVEVRGEKAWRNTIIGEGTLSSVPPLLSSYDDSESQDDHLDWEGTLKCNDIVTVGGFAVANIQVKEFIVLNIAPQSPSKSSLLDLQLSIPIRLVTESFSEPTGESNNSSSQ